MVNSTDDNKKPVFVTPKKKKRTDSGLIFNPTGGDADFEMAPIPFFLERQCSPTIKSAIQFQHDLMKAHANDLEAGMGLLGVLGNLGFAFLCREHLGVLGNKLGLEVVTAPSDDLGQQTAQF